MFEIRSVKCPNVPEPNVPKFKNSTNYTYFNR